MARKTQKKAHEPLIYIGRTFPGLTRYTVFTEGRLPPHVEQMIKQNERIRGLIVPVKGLQTARRDVKTNGHILNYLATHLVDKE